MKLLFLRGQVPQDRSPGEIQHNSIDKEDDVWTHLAYRLGKECCEVVYWGGDWIMPYGNSCTIRWVRNLKNYECSFKPDVIWARGGFLEYKSVLKKYPDAYKVYYGSGARYRPTDGIKYDLVLCDSERQFKKLNAACFNVSYWVKPAVDTMFFPKDVKKKYDVGYVGDARFSFRARIKGIKLAYTVPKDLRMLHLGWSGKYKVPKNVKVKRVKRWEMADEICKCKCIIVPYTDYDSCPRIIPEALACNVPVVALDSCHFLSNLYPSRVTDKTGLWSAVRQQIKNKENVGQMYAERLSLPNSVRHLRGIIRYERKNENSSVLWPF